MSFLDQVTVLILTQNEANNIGRTLSALGRFKHIVIVDSGSSDDTTTIASQFSNVRLIVHGFDSHAEQWNYGLTQCGISTPWVLALDADYVLPRAMVEEIAALTPNKDSGGFRSKFRYCVNGHALRGSLYPPVVILYRREVAHYVQDGHTQRVVVQGSIRKLSNEVYHDDRKPLDRWFRSQQRYARLEAEKLLRTPAGDLRFTDRIRLTGWAGPICVFVYTLVWKRCWMDGFSGWYYVLQRTLAEAFIALEVIVRGDRLPAPTSTREERASAQAADQFDPERVVDERGRSRPLSGPVSGEDVDAMSKSRSSSG